MNIYTIGHSNHTWEAFAALLKQHEVQVLVDTRTNPTSRWAAFSNKRTLPVLLKDEGIGYLYMGNLLGGKPADPSCYDEEGKPDYRRIRATAFFQEGVSELLVLAEDSTIALMCAEEDPGKCHRALLIGPALEEHSVKPLHIRADGSVQSSESLAGQKAYQRQLQGELPLEESDS